VAGIARAGESPPESWDDAMGDGGDDGDQKVPRGSWSRRNDIAAKKKGKTWHKYMKSTRELKRLQNLMPDLEGGSLFADENTGEAYAGFAFDSPPDGESVSLESILERSGLAYVANGGKLEDIEALLSNLGWDYLSRKGETKSPGETPSPDSQEEDEYHPWSRPVSRPTDSGDELEDSLDTAVQKSDWAEYNHPRSEEEAAEDRKPVEQQVLERAMHASALRLIHELDEQSMMRAKVAWSLKEKFKSEFVLSNYLSKMAREIQDEMDGIELVSYPETGVFFSKYKPVITSKVLFDLEERIESGEVDIDRINQLQLENDRKSDLLEKSIAHLCRRAMALEVIQHLKGNLSYKQEQKKLDPWDRLNLDALEQQLGLKKVDDMIVRRKDVAEPDFGDEDDEDCEEIEEGTVLDTLLQDKSDGSDESEETFGLFDLESAKQKTFKPTIAEDFLPEIPHDGMLQLDIDGELVQIELAKAGEKAVWIKQLLGYQQSDKDLMSNFHEIMAKIERNFETKGRERKRKKGKRGDLRPNRSRLASAPAPDESQLFQDALDIFEQDTDLAP